MAVSSKGDGGTKGEQGRLKPRERLNDADLDNDPPHQQRSGTCRPEIISPRASPSSKRGRCHGQPDDHEKSATCELRALERQPRDHEGPPGITD
jgi:hypothetical protein